MRLASIISAVRQSNGVEWLIPKGRTGRLPLPRHVAELTPSDEPALVWVNAFADRLVELPLSAWLSIGRSISSDRDRVLVRGEAWDTLDTTIARHGLGISAWYARDTVETAAFLASRGKAGWSRDERRVFAAAHAAAESAALALLARAHLSASAVRILYAPFETYIAFAELGTISVDPVDQHETPLLARHGDRS